MVWIVVPAGMSLPVTISPANSPVVLVISDTTADPLVSILPVSGVDVDATLASQIVLLPTSYKLTDSPGSVVPMKIGVRSLVTPSPIIPVSVAGSRWKLLVRQVSQ